MSIKVIYHESPHSYAAWFEDTLRSDAPAVNGQSGVIDCMFGLTEAQERGVKLILSGKWTGPDAYLWATAMEHSYRADWRRQSPYQERVADAWANLADLALCSDHDDYGCTDRALEEYIPRS